MWEGAREVAEWFRPVCLRLVELLVPTERILEAVSLGVTDNRCCHSKLSVCSKGIAVDFGHEVSGCGN
jgi:hypothetical protein